MKKPKYKEVAPKKQWVVVADYQPGSMWSRPEDTKRSSHEELGDAIIEMEKHKKAGASGIEILHRFITLEMK